MGDGEGGTKLKEKGEGGKTRLGVSHFFETVERDLSLYFLPTVLFGGGEERNEEFFFKKKISGV